MYKKLIIGGILLLGGGVVVAQLDKPVDTGVEAKYEDIGWVKPKTDEDWAKDTEKEGLNYRFDFQLEEMLVSHSAKVPELKKLYEKATKYPDAIRYELVERGLVEPDLTEQVNQRIEQAKVDYARIQQIVERLNKEIELRKQGKVDRTEGLKGITPSTDEERKELSKLKSEK